MTAALVERHSPLAYPNPGPAVHRRVLQELDDCQVAQRHLDGDPQAFGSLVDRYQSRLLGFVARNTGDRERAEDLVQEAFIRVFRHLHHFDQTRKFSTWIYTIASNLCKNEVRNRRRSPLMPFPLGGGANAASNQRPVEFEDRSTRPDEMYHQRCLADAVQQSVKELGPRHREVFVLRELEGKSYAEIAEIAGCTLGTVKSRLNRARNRFAQVIEPLLD